MMRLVGATILVACGMLAGADHPAGARGGGGGAVPACTASTPAQATSAGYTKLTLCDALQTLQGVDLKDSASAAFRWFPRKINSGVASPAAGISHDGTGLQLAGITGNRDSLYSAVYAAGAPGGYVGHVLGGGYYIEVEMKYDASLAYAEPPPSFPAFYLPPTDWLSHANAGEVGLEIDIIEQYSSGSGGATRALYTVYDENRYLVDGTYYGYQLVVNASQDAAYHKYGLLRVPTGDGGGTGTFTWYVDDVALTSLAYTQAGQPSHACSAGNAGCSFNGAFFDTDGSVNYIALLGGGVGWPSTFRNLHVWQKP